MRVTIKVGIADNHPIYRLGLQKLLEPEDDLILIGEATNGMEAVLLAERYDPDILLLDLKMPVMDGIEVLSELAKRKMRTRVILMLTEAERDKAVRGVRLGARGILFYKCENDFSFHLNLVVSGNLQRDQGRAIFSPRILSRASEPIDIHNPSVPRCHNRKPCR